MSVDFPRGICAEDSWQLPQAYFGNKVPVNHIGNPEKP